MTVEDALKEYKEFIGTVFSNPRKWSMRGPMPSPFHTKYSPKNLKEAVQSVVRRQAAIKYASYNNQTPWQRPAGDEIFSMESSMCRT